MNSTKKIFESDLIKSTGDNWNNAYGGYFFDKAPLDSLWSIIKPFIVSNKKSISVIELGSANANLCHFLVGKIKAIYDHVEAYAVDVQPESINSINKNEVNKIVADIRYWSSELLFDLIFMRSVLHYNNLEDQVVILNNIFNVMSKDSIFFHQLLSGDDQTLNLYHKIQKEVFGRSVLVINEEKYLETARSIFSETEKIGDCLPISISAKDMLDRFSENEDQRKINWKKMKKVSGWQDEGESVVLKFPVFKHKA